MGHLAFSFGRQVSIRDFVHERFYQIDAKLNLWSADQPPPVIPCDEGTGVNPSLVGAPSAPPSKVCCPCKE